MSVRLSVVGRSVGSVLPSVQRKNFLMVASIKKCVRVKSCHILKKDKNGGFILDFLDQICPKMDQT